MAALREQVAGFVLTGGRSSRMGRDKAMLPVNGQALCEHIGDVLSQVADSVLLIGHPERYAHLKYECVADLRPDMGPMSGVETALSLGRAEFHLIASCDMANIRREWMECLLAEARRGSACVAAEDAAGHIQPLCAVYRSECAPLISKELRAGRLRMLDLLKELKVRTVKLEDAVLNVNTPEDYATIANAKRRE